MPYPKERKEAVLKKMLPPKNKPIQELAQDEKRIKELERELKRKEKALAETAALLVLRKKAQAIWGDGE
ncbi:hypothetical protein, partial [Thiolapillus sp.]|uniref:hypothetical protein n=1 Tax=Thiolapillus sp. TaxID=2017437 RepID=UPI003AF92D12